MLYEVRHGLVMTEPAETAMVQVLSILGMMTVEPWIEPRASAVFASHKCNNCTQIRHTVATRPNGLEVTRECEPWPLMHYISPKLWRTDCCLHRSTNSWSTKVVVKVSYTILETDKNWLANWKVNMIVLLSSIHACSWLIKQEITDIQRSIAKQTLQAKLQMINQNTNLLLSHNINCEVSSNSQFFRISQPCC